MKILFIAGPTKSSLFGLAPLAIAARMSGHEVVMASTQEVVPATMSVGLPAFPLAALTLAELMTTDRAGDPLRIPAEDAAFVPFVGRMFGRLAAISLDPLRDLVGGWRPDLIVGGPHAYAAPILATELGVPCVRHLLTGNPVDREGTHPGVDEELRPELAALGLAQVPPFHLALDIFPASTRIDDVPPAQPVRPLRWIPTNQQQPVAPWMLSRGPRRRVLVTAGSLVTTTHNFDFLHGLAGTLAEQDVEVVVAAPPEVGRALHDVPGVRHAGWLPLDVVLPHCDLIVHHSGTMTALTALNAGVPQLIVPQESRFIEWARNLSTLGVAQTLAPGEDTPEAVGKVARLLLEDPVHATSAAAIAREIAEMPGPTEVVGQLTEFATRGLTCASS
ncbi:glycosyltransferase [Micromonospora sp. ATCC 39149]|uniref:Glycosyltransferase family 1 protein n=1 Tax=Micromonospora carbonacea TaxID=47853 RepID=A0A7D6C6Q8_9ACTN|nr:glycosyltransferase [Micromonospora sp. ATCC 39149]QLJ99344.2 glycosyltransferase family 1 protein [Micromonospora carbonacea]